MMGKAIERFLDKVESIDDLPTAVGAAIRQYDAAVQSIIVIPPQEYPIRRIGWLGDLPFGWRLTPRRTIAFCASQIIVVECDAKGVLTTKVIPIQALTSIELTTVLLYAYLCFTWSEAAQVETMKIEFNAVDEHIIRALLTTPRAAIAAQGPAVPPIVKVSSRDLPLKFRNYLRLALLPDEHVAAAIYQPPIRRAERWLRAFLSPGRTIAVTSQHVIVLEDDIKAHMQYTMATRFCPLRSIRRVTFQQASEAIWTRLTLGTAEAEHEITFPLLESEAAALRNALCMVLPVPVMDLPGDPLKIASGVSYA